MLAVGWPVGQGQNTVTTDYAREHPLFGSVCLAGGPGGQ